MNRRVFAGAVAAVVVASKIDLGWITIAHLGTNSAGRTYTEEHMAILARDVVPGMKVMEWYHDEPPTLDQMYGVVTHAGRIGDEYQVKVRWFDGKRPQVKSWLSLHGSMTVHGDAKDGSTGFTMIEIFHLEPSSAGSNFQRATAI